MRRLTLAAIATVTVIAALVTPPALAEGTVTAADADQPFAGAQPAALTKAPDAAQALAPVRFPRPAAEADGIDLDGESDEDDEQLHALMRARLAMSERGGGDDDDDGGRPARDERPPVVRATR